MRFFLPKSPGNFYPEILMNERQNHIVARSEAGLIILNKPQHQAVWKDKKPLRFTELVGEVTVQVGKIGGEAGKQGLATTGNAKDKKRERKELVESADALSRAMTRCLRAARNEAEADKWDLTTSEWRDLADIELSEKSDLLIEAADALSKGADAAKAAKYGIDADAVAATTKERADFVSVMNLPVAGIAGRKVVSLGIPVLVKQLKEMLKEMKDLIVQFRKTDGGEELITAFREATKNRLGNGGGDDDEETPLAPTPPAG